MDTKIVDKIKKLLALSKSPNENEAILAYQMAQELLTKHNISLDDIQVDINILEETIWLGEEMEEWKFILYSVVAECNYCRLVVTSFNDKNFRYNLIGREHNIIVVKEIRGYLLDTIKRICEEKAEELNEKYKTTGLMLTDLAFKSVRIGIVKGICSRLLRQKKQVQNEGIHAESENEPAGEKTTTLTISKLYNKESEKIQQYLNSKHSNIQQLSGFNSDYISKFVAEGQHESRKIGLNTQIKKGDFNE